MLAMLCIAVLTIPAQAWAAAPSACEGLRAKYPDLKGKTIVDAINPHTPGYEALDPQDPSKYVGFDIDLAGIAAPEADRRATELLGRVGLAHRADALPRHLSGGQQQRVAIARALAPRPKVLLLDEPTSALDPELVSEVLDVIRRLATEDGLTMIISTHQLRFAREVADRVVFLSGGVVTEQGPAQEVLTAPKHPVTARLLQLMGSDQATEALARA